MSSHATDNLKKAFEWNNYKSSFTTLLDTIGHPMPSTTDGRPIPYYSFGVSMTANIKDVYYDPFRKSTSKKTVFPSVSSNSVEKPNGKNISQVTWFMDLVRCAYKFAKEEIFKVKDTDPEKFKRLWTYGLFLYLKVVPEPFRIAGTAFTTAYIIGLYQDINCESGPIHIDKPDDCSCLIGAGKVRTGGSTHYYSKLGKDDYKSSLEIGFQHGRMQFGEYNTTYHRVGSWEGIRQMYNINAKRNVLHHFLDQGNYVFRLYMYHGQGLVRDMEKMFLKELEKNNEKDENKCYNYVMHFPLPNIDWPDLNTMRKPTKRYKSIANKSTPTNINTSKPSNEMNNNHNNNNIHITTSFGALWKGNFKEHIKPFCGRTKEEETKHRDIYSTRKLDSFVEDVKYKIHTLIVGSHPGEQSLELGRYYAHPTNLFWWIAGENLGFRRCEGMMADGSRLFKLCENLQNKNDLIIPYPEQVETLVDHGFAIWDAVKSCTREGSLDSNMYVHELNDLKKFVQTHTHISRIVFANGKSSAKDFVKQYEGWINDDSSEMLLPSEDNLSMDVFAKWGNRRELIGAFGSSNSSVRHVELTCVDSVSSSAAKVSYEEKFKNWSDHCYQPGLRINETLNHKDN